MHPAIYWRPTTNNRKTGNIPTAYVGATREEAKETCKGCPLLEKSCYAQRGIVAVAQNSLLKGVASKGRAKYTIEKALKDRRVSAKFARFTAIGDGARCDATEVRSAYNKVRSEGLGWLAYTHFWKEAKAKGLTDVFVASVNSFSELSEALNAGFRRAAITVEWDFYRSGQRTMVTEDGKKGILCPALAAHAKGKRVTCNDCGLCDPARSGPDFVMFPDHGPGVSAKIKRAAAQSEEWAINLSKPL
jgi:hypothetical protein